MTIGIFDELLGGKATDVQGNLTEQQRQSDKERCRHSLILFAETYLSEFVTDKLCDFHIDIANHLEDLVIKKPHERTYSCIAAPRGFGKSFWSSMAFPLWVIAYKHADNVMIVSSEGSLSRQFIMDIRQQITDNEKFIEDFGNQEGEIIWTQDKIVTKNGVAIIGKGSGMALRGTKVFGKRCDFIICDDILNSDNSDSPEQRQKLYDWYMKVMCPCVSKYGKVVVIGTILSDPCLLNQLLTQPRFAEYYRKKYQAVINFSESELWAEWESKLQNLSSDNPAQDAFDFYKANKDEMVKGTSVLWEREEDMYMKLMKIRALDINAFSTECQNDGLLESSREFQEEWITKNYYLPEELPEITDVYIGVDGSMGNNRHSDYSAIVCVGKGSDNFLYVLDVFAKIISIPELADQMVLFGLQYHDKIRSIRIEDVVFQLLIKNIMEKRAMESGLYLPFEGIKVAGLGKKEFKLRSLIIPVRNGYLKFRKDQHRLLNEMRRFPVSSTDDAMDALWIATYGLLGKSISQFSFGSVSSGNTTKPKSQQSFFGKLFNR